MANSRKEIDDQTNKLQAMAAKDIQDAAIARKIEKLEKEEDEKKKQGCVAKESKGDGAQENKGDGSHESKGGDGAPGK